MGFIRNTYLCNDMNTLKHLVAFIIILACMISACKKDVKDTEPPLIHSDWASSFPAQCDTLVLGETYSIQLKFSDNQELASFSIEIHHNFDLHSHDGIGTECFADTSKTPVYPFYYVNTFQIPSGKTDFLSNSVIWIPEADCCDIPYDDGMYHCKVVLTDKAELSDTMYLNIRLVRIQD
jgi:hypothetical protein